MVFPTRNIVPVFIVCLVVLGGLFALLEYQNQTKTTNNGNMISVADQRIIDSIANKDTDSDGLKDWEEALWQTDPNNPDTNGNGIKDGAEVAKLSLETTSSTPKTTKPLTSSDQFSRDLFTRYVSIKQTGSGDPADYNNYTDLVQSYIDKEATALSANIHSATDFKVIAKETPADIHRYGNEFGALFVTDETPDLENELVILNRATENQNQTELNKLDKNIAAYEEILNGLLKISVPESFLPDHLTLTNAVETIILGIKSMKFSFSDPLKAAAGLKNYPDAAGNILPLLRNIGGGLEESGVTFTQTETGYRFINLVK